MTYNGSLLFKVLYVEDEKDIQFLLSTRLSILGYETACAENGKLGVEKAQSWQPDLILTDLCMPVMDGLVAIRRLRNDPDTAQIPIFAVSSYTDHETRETCRKAGADRVFAKPFEFDKIDSAIREALM